MENRSLEILVRQDGIGFDPGISTRKIQIRATIWIRTPGRELGKLFKVCLTELPLD